MSMESVNTVFFFIDLGNHVEGDLPEDFELVHDKLQLSLGVPDKDFKVFTDVLRRNGITYTVIPAGAVKIAPQETHIGYEDDHYEGEN
jgi:hypothetical protein